MNWLYIGIKPGYIQTKQRKKEKLVFILLLAKECMAAKAMGFSVLITKCADAADRAEPS